jgi:alpha-beta hydrolase superfamily lysophospholipase
MPDPSEVVARLGADPMYQLSTAGQERFHTNMLYWLATRRPAESARYAQDWGSDEEL